MAKPNPISTTTPEYVALRECYENIIAVVTSDPDALYDALFSKGCLTESVRNYIRTDSLPNDKKARRLIDHVIDQIRLDTNAFQKFIEALKHPYYNNVKKKLIERYQTETKKQCSKDSSPAKAESFDLKPSFPDKSFVCPYCKKCSLERYLSDEGCPEATGKTLFPYLKTRGLSEEERMKLEDTLAYEAKVLRTLFAHTDNCVAQRLNADVMLVKNYTLNLVKDLEQKENEAKIDKATSIPEVIYALHPYKSFLSYEIIESIVTEFGSSELCRAMEKYATAFENFCKRSAFELPTNVLFKGSKAEKILSVKLSKVVQASLRNICSARQKIASILGVKMWALKICSIEDGCVCVRFLVPAAVMSKIFPLSLDKKNALRDAGISIGEESEARNR